MKTTTTTTAGKIEKPLNIQPGPLSDSSKGYTRKELAATVLDLSGEDHDPQYLAEIANGGRRNKRLSPFIKKAVAKLVSRRHGNKDKTL